MARLCLDPSTKILLSGRWFSRRLRWVPSSIPRMAWSKSPRWIVFPPARPWVLAVGVRAPSPCGGGASPLVVGVCTGFVVSSFIVRVGVSDTITFGAAASCFSWALYTSSADFCQVVSVGSRPSVQFLLTWRDVANDSIIPKKSSAFIPSAISVDSP